MMPWRLMLTAAGYVLAATLFWLLLEAREDIGEAVEKCNADKLLAVANAEKITRESVERAMASRLAQLARQRDAESRARALAEEGRLRAVEGASERERTIERLRAEAATDDIPDSFESLNVFVPCGVLTGVLYPGSGGEADTGGGGNHQVCADTGGFAAGGGAFSNITYGDALILWGQDRGKLVTVNARLGAIRALQNGLVED